jgi:hypothetical protein
MYIDVYLNFLLLKNKKIVIVMIIARDDKHFFLNIVLAMLRYFLKILYSFALYASGL